MDGKLDLAKSLGADIVINSREEDPVARVKALTGGRGADVVVEAAGTAESLQCRQRHDPSQWKVRFLQLGDYSGEFKYKSVA